MDFHLLLGKDEYVVANIGNFKLWFYYYTELLTAFDYKPAFQIAAEGRQIYKTADHIQYQQYVCVGEHEDEKI